MEEKRHTVRQKVVMVSSCDGAYSNFFFTRGSAGSLEWHIESGWMLKFIKDDTTKQQAVAVFEKEDIHA